MTYLNMKFNITSPTIVLHDVISCYITQVWYKETVILQREQMT